MNPHPSDESYNHFYENQYRSFYGDSVHPTQEEKSKQRSRAKTLLSFLELRSLDIKSHLEVGCSTGQFLSEVENTLQLSRQSVGVELDINYSKAAETLGIKCYSKLEQVQHDQPKFCLISMNHVLEHMNNPVDFLRHLRESFLEKRGYVYIEVPNYQGLFGSFEIAHPIVFTEESLENTIKLAGFKIIEMKSHANPRTENPKAKFYTSALIAPSDSKLQVQPPRYSNNLTMFKLNAYQSLTLEGALIFWLKLPLRLVKNLGLPKHVV
tara:strand:+ start:1036 stop:1836 length:801 start_codon:yes stop_codon:yes gene_type:complete